MVNFVGKLCLAPMVRLGELPTRIMSLAHGCDLVWSPEIVDKKIILTTRVANPSLGTVEYVVNQVIKLKKKGESVRRYVIFQTSPQIETGKLIFQLGLANPELAVTAALKVIDDVDGIDLNCGCPKPFSTHAGMGAALLSTPDLLCLILTALVEKVGKVHGKPILCKIRLLDTLDATKKLISDICDTGIANLTIHCRTRDMRNRQDPRWKFLPTIIPFVQEKGILVVINGNLQNKTDIINMRKVLKNEEIGGMMAEAAECNPLVFSLTPLTAKENIIEFIGYCAKYQPDNMAHTKFMVLNMVPGKLKYFLRYAKLRDLAGFLAITEELKSETEDIIVNYLAKDCQRQVVLDKESYETFINVERVKEMELSLSRQPGDIDRGDMIKMEEKAAAQARKRAREEQEVGGETKRAREGEIEVECN